MVLDGFLEDFLQGARAARGEDDAAKGQRQDVILAQAVLKEFGDVGSKRCRRFVAVNPGGNAQADELLLRVLLDDLKCQTQPALVLERRCH